MSIGIANAIGRIGLRKIFSGQNKGFRGRMKTENGKNGMSKQQPQEFDDLAERQGSDSADDYSDRTFHKRNLSNKGEILKNCYVVVKRLTVLETVFLMSVLFTMKSTNPFS